MIDYYAVGSELNDVLRRENETLSVILMEQHTIREAVRQKNWQSLEAALYKTEKLSVEFSALEKEREQILDCVNADLGREQDIYQCAAYFPRDLRGYILENYRLLRQKLAVSKIENDSLNEYVSVTKEFLQGIFDTVLPQGRSTTYSRSGHIVKTQPESLVLDRFF